ncbi:MAG: hypothetical protein KAG66_08735, partial [Methylococcales bacterium]|nr:hypothetical protein [Methylococcales bacterium]
LKFWLNVSKQEQKQRFLDRLNTPEKNWKFSGGDLKERKLWPQYMQAYEEMINATSTQHAPWHVIPADNKLWMRAAIAKIIVQKLSQLDLRYPEPQNLEQFDNYTTQLLSES